MLMLKYQVSTHVEQWADLDVEKTTYSVDLPHEKKNKFCCLNFRSG